MTDLGIDNQKLKSIKRPDFDDIYRKIKKDKANEKIHKINPKILKMIQKSKFKQSEFTNDLM